MFSKTKIALIGVTLSILAGCTGTTYNDAKNCTEDYLLHPAVSIPAIIGACDSVK